MDEKTHKHYFGYGFKYKNTYEEGAEDQEMRKVSRHKRFVTKERTGPLKCNCKLDKNGHKCNKRSQLDGKGRMIDQDACPNLTYNYECQSEVCGRGCQNQHLQKFNRIGKMPPVRVKNTGLYGLGLFAEKVLHSGTTIGEYIGVIRCQNKKKRNVVSNYVFGLGDGFPGKYDLILDASEKGNYTRYCNHSCDPNCSTQQIIVGNHFHIIIKTNKEIAVGEQVTISYGKGYFYYGKKCQCGSSNCISKQDKKK